MPWGLAASEDFSVLDRVNERSVKLFEIALVVEEIYLLRVPTGAGLGSVQ